MMSGRPTSKRNHRKPKAGLLLPDLHQAKSAVLNSLTSADAQHGYRHAIDEVKNRAILIPGFHRLLKILSNWTRATLTRAQNCGFSICTVVQVGSSEQVFAVEIVRGSFVRR